VFGRWLGESKARIDSQFRSANETLGGIQNQTTNVARGAAGVARDTAGVIVAFIPSGIAGAALHGFIKDVLFAPSVAPYVIATTLILGGIIILLVERIAPQPRYHDADRLPYSKCFQIGLCQVISIIPGVSRSGATILGGELLGVDRKAAAEFTFYLAVPTMLGASVLDVYSNREILTLDAGLTIAVGFVVSFLVAWVVVKTFIGFVGRYGLKPFGWYRILAGALIFAILAL
jgi:undecaprenyl-diphosphatase